MKETRVSGIQERPDPQKSRTTILWLPEQESVTFLPERYLPHSSDSRWGPLPQGLGSSRVTYATQTTATGPMGGPQECWDSSPGTGIVSPID